MKYKAQIFVLPDGLSEVYSAIKHHIGNDDWPDKPATDHLGNKPEDLLRLWVARKIEETFTAVFDPVEGFSFHTNLLRNDILNFLDQLYGPNPFDELSKEMPRTFGTYFDVKPLTKTTLMIYERNEATQKRNIRNTRSRYRPTGISRISSRIEPDGSTVITISGL